MSELTKAKRRIKQLERCLEAVRNNAADEVEYWVRSHGVEEDDASIAVLQGIVQRANRTIKVVPTEPPDLRTPKEIKWGL